MPSNARIYFTTTVVALRGTPTRGQHSPMGGGLRQQGPKARMEFLGEAGSPLTTRLGGVLQYLEVGAEVIFDSPPIGAP